MKNKQNVLRQLESISGILRNIEREAKTGNSRENLVVFVEQLQAKMANIENWILLENE